MADDRGIIRQVAWRDLFPATLLLSTIRLAANFRALSMAALGFVAMVGGWWVIGKAFSNTTDVDLRQTIEKHSRLAPWSDGPGFVDPRLPGASVPRTFDPRDANRLLVPPPGPFAATADRFPIGGMPPALTPHVNDALTFDWPIAGPTRLWNTTSPLFAAWETLTAPFLEMFDSRLSSLAFVHLLICGLWALAVWAFFGAAITRMAAVALAREEQVSFGRAISFAATKWAAFFTAPLFPLLGVLLAALPLALFGLLLTFDVGVLIAGVLWFLVIAAGVVMAVLLVGLLFGWPLMWATISTEGTDSFDALSRSYAYTYQRPLHYLLYALIAAILGAVGWVLISIFASAVIALGIWGVSWGCGGNRLTEIFTIGGNSSREMGASLIRFWVGCVLTFALAFIFSYFWTAATAIYLLLRRLVDATETDEVFMPEQQEMYGLPPLTEDAAGVPGAADLGGPGANGGA